jgi:hypothetical protein
VGGKRTALPVAEDNNDAAIAVQGGSNTGLDQGRDAHSRLRRQDCHALRTAVLNDLADNVRTTAKQVLVILSENFKLPQKCTINYKESLVFWGSPKYGMLSIQKGFG